MLVVSFRQLCMDNHLYGVGAIKVTPGAINRAFAWQCRITLFKDSTKIVIVYVQFGYRDVLSKTARYFLFLPQCIIVGQKRQGGRHSV